MALDSYASPNIIPELRQLDWPPESPDNQYHLFK